MLRRLHSMRLAAVVLLLLMGLGPCACKGLGPGSSGANIRVNNKGAAHTDGRPLISAAGASQGSEQQGKQSYLAGQQLLLQAGHVEGHGFNSQADEGSRQQLTWVNDGDAAGMEDGRADQQTSQG